MGDRTSGGRELALGRLRAVGHPIPEVLVSADDITRGKPQPSRTSGQALGADPSECLVIEDAPAGSPPPGRRDARRGAQTSHRAEDWASGAVYASMDEVRRAEL